MSVSARFSLDAHGYFQRGGRRVVPVGVNYWPASCGVAMWRDWPAKEIEADLRLVRQLGLNCVRFFLRWEDFEPQPGRYDATAFRRLGKLLGWCRRHGLLAHPSLFVGWMSGGIFWPAWKQGRNLFADPFMRERAFAFAAQAARVCARYRDTILALDQGNEICCLPDAPAAPPADVESWCIGVNASVRREYSDVLLVSGNEQAQIVADSGWRLGTQPGCDFISMHAYPNPAWHSLPFDGMADPLAQSMLPLYVKCARAFGPVMVQEFGTLFTGGSCATEYLKAMLPACWEAGANGFLWWCLRDIIASDHPYDKNAFEGGMGLVDRNDHVKPALRCFMEFAASLPDRPPAVADQGDIALYWPKHYYHRDNPLNPGNEPRALSRRLAVAHFALTALGHRTGIVRGDRPLKDISARTIVVPGAFLTAGEMEALVAWVRRGGRLVWHGADAITWGSGACQLAGADAVDFLSPRAEGVKAFGTRWDFRHFPRDVFTGVIPRSARVAARDRTRRPLVLAHRLGRGRTAVCLAQPEDHFATEADDRSSRTRWLRWYAGMLALVS